MAYDRDGYEKTGFMGEENILRWIYGLVVEQGTWRT
jgi:hypothetical protein